MSVCTFGLYQVYWFYWNWRLIKYREGRHLSPPWRSVLGLVFALPLFRRMSQPTGRYGLALAGVCFLAWSVLTLASYGPAPWAVLTLGSVAPLLPLQVLANRVNAKHSPGHIPNRRLSGWNIVAVVFGGLLVALSLLGLALSAAQA